MVVEATLYPVIPIMLLGARFRIPMLMIFTEQEHTILTIPGKDAALHIFIRAHRIT